MIAEHYIAQNNLTNKYEIPKNQVSVPTSSSFANLQGIVKIYHPDKITELRQKFVELGLPTLGFDRDWNLSPWPDPPQPSQTNHMVIGSVANLQVGNNNRQEIGSQTNSHHQTHIETNGSWNWVTTKQEIKGPEKTSGIWGSLVKVIAGIPALGAALKVLFGWFGSWIPFSVFGGRNG